MNEKAKLELRSSGFLVSEKIGTRKVKPSVSDMGMSAVAKKTPTP